MPGRRKFYMCPNSGCDKALPRYRLDEHIKSCRVKLNRGYVGKLREGHIRRTWHCSGVGCSKTFRTEKACAKHVEICSGFQIDH